MLQIKPLTEKEFQKYILGIFTNVFKSSDPFGKPLASSIHHRAILYPINYELDATELQAISLAAQAVGDDGFYLSVTERSSEVVQDCPYHWYIPLEDLGNYRDLRTPFVLENVLYSPKGKWGMITSHEQHAVVGGNTRFLNTLFSHLPISAERQLKEFLATWKDNHDRFGTNIAWMSGLLTHVYGEEKARELQIWLGKD